VAVSAEQLARELRAFDDRRALVKAMRRGLNKAAKTQVTPAIREHAVAILPKSGGLNAWVAAARVTTSIRYGSRTAGIRLRGSRKSLKNKSDLQRIDAGKVRAPTWGRRGPGFWHTQAVAPGWFTDPASKSTAFRDTVDAEVDRVLDEIRG
jgi:hypothetical protein